MLTEAPTPAPGAATSRPAGRRGPLPWALAALSGILMVFSFPSYDQDYLIWITLVPLLWAAAGAGAWRGLLLGLLSGAILVGWGFSWVHHAMREFTGLGPVASIAAFSPWVLFESIPWALLGLILGLLPGPASGRPALVFLAIPLWVGIEHYFPHIFPWHVGGALYERSFLMNNADLLGASGLTALILLWNVVAYLGLVWLLGHAPFPRRSLALAALLLAGANLYGWLRLGQVESALARAPELRVGIVQPVTRPQDKLRGDWDSFVRMVNRTRGLEQQERLDLVVWPEGADTMGYLIGAEGTIHRRDMNREGKTGYESITVPAVVGTWSHHETSRLDRNTAAYVLPGSSRPQDFYDKNKPLLFGEYVPLLDHLPEWLRSRIGYVGNIEPGTQSPLLDLPVRGSTFRFRILICYEAVLPEYVREVSEGADFLVNVTEDIWYGDTAHIPQHLSVLRVRAVEDRIAIVRAANVGPSGVIEPTGRMPERTRPFDSRADRAFTLRPVHLSSFYAKLGFLFPGVSLAAGVVLFARYVRKGRPGAQKVEIMSSGGKKSWSS